MAHFRERHAQVFFEKLNRYSPIVGVFGHRQVGKTTFVSHSVASYVTLDDEDQLKQALAGAKAFVAAHGMEQTVIDECQMAPPLFPALKEWVRTHPKPGQFVLTGSVRFTSRKAVRESLTGRMVSLELYPMVLSELLERHRRLPAGVNLTAASGKSAFTGSWLNQR
jgi:predicted AAA+ superfamily ATPase